MADITMRGLSCAVARHDADAPGASGIALGLDHNSVDDRIALCLRHADGTTLTGYLSDALLSRLADILSGLGNQSRLAPRTLQ